MPQHKKPVTKQEYESLSDLQENPRKNSSENQYTSLQDVIPKMKPKPLLTCFVAMFNACTTAEEDKTPIGEAERVKVRYNVLPTTPKMM